MECKCTGQICCHSGFRHLKAQRLRPAGFNPPKRQLQAALLTPVSRRKKTIQNSCSQMALTPHSIQSHEDILFRASVLISRILHKKLHPKRHRILCLRNQKIGNQDFSDCIRASPQKSVSIQPKRLCKVKLSSVQFSGSAPARSEFRSRKRQALQSSLQPLCLFRLLLKTCF